MYAFNKAASELGVRVSKDLESAQELAAQAQQHVLEGNTDLAKQYQAEAASFLTEAKTHRDRAKEMRAKAKKLQGAIPIIEMKSRDAGRAAA